MHSHLKTCVICKSRFKGYGNNAQPVKEGVCCDLCNTVRIIPARIKRIKTKLKPAQAGKGVV